MPEPSELAEEKGKIFSFKNIWDHKSPGGKNKLNTERKPVPVVFKVLNMRL
jgi:hypothetical protein